MSYFKTLIVIVFVLCPFLSFAEWGADDRQMLSQIFTKITNYPEYQDYLSGIQANTGDAASDLHNLYNDFKSFTSGNLNQLYDLYAKLDSIHTTIKIFKCPIGLMKISCM